LICATSTVRVGRDVRVAKRVALQFEAGRGVEQDQVGLGRARAALSCTVTRRLLPRVPSYLAVSVTAFAGVVFWSALVALAAAEAARAIDEHLTGATASV
jgi:hypothetical protein